MKYLFIILCTLISIINWYYPLNFGYSQSSSVLSHFTYIFVHANIIHLGMNMFVFWKLYDYVKYLKFGIIIAFIASFYCNMHVTVGASGVIFALLGIFYAKYKFKPKFYITNFSFLAIASVVGYFSNVNVKLHLVCLSVGFIMAFFYKYVLRN